MFIVGMSRYGEIFEDVLFILDCNQASQFTQKVKDMF